MTSPNPYQPPAAELEGPAAASPSSTTGGPTDRMVAELAGTGPWVRFIAVVGFVFSGLIAIAALVGLVTAVAAFRKTDDIWMGLAGAALYLVTAATYFFVSQKLWGYGDAIRKVTAVRSPLTVELALASQRSAWKTLGILTIVMLVIGLVAFVGVIVVAGLGIMSRH